MGICKCDIPVVVGERKGNGRVGREGVYPRAIMVPAGSWWRRKAEGRWFLRAHEPYVRTPSGYRFGQTSHLPVCGRLMMPVPGADAARNRKANKSETECLTGPDVLYFVLEASGLRIILKFHAPNRAQSARRCWEENVGTCFIAKYGKN